MADLVEQCKGILDKTWESVVDEISRQPGYSPLGDVEPRKLVRDCVNSATKSYRYVLPTQLLAKLADPTLDSHCIQASRGRAGSFDARSLCHKVVVPFERRNHNVLGGSPEPYVNNPLRVPEVSATYAGSQKDKTGWESLIAILDAVEKTASEDFTLAVFKQALVEIYHRLSLVAVTYPVPRRISLNRTESLINQYLASPSGGERALTIVSALMQTMGERFHLFSTVRRASITTADAPAGFVADIECLDSENTIVLAVEVKDRELRFNHIDTKLPNIRARRVSEILYVTQKGIAAEDRQRIEDLVDKEFVSGQNLYIFEDIPNLSSGLLALLGESGRHRFLECVGNHLDTYGAGIQHKSDWASLLGKS